MEKTIAAEILAASPPPSGAGLRVLGLGAAMSLAASFSKKLGEIYRIALAQGVCPSCYTRNIPTLSLGEQLHLANAAVHIAGAGGLGGAVALMLAHLGIGKMIVVDYDSFEESNLNRQLFSRRETLGKAKVDVVAQDIAKVNPAVEVVARACRIEESNVGEAFAAASLIVDALDSVATRKLVAAYAAAAKIPFVHGAVGGFVGQMASFSPGDKASFADVFPATPETRRVAVLPFMPVLVAGFQVAAALKILLGRETALPQGKALLHMDLSRGLFRTIDI